MRLDRAHWTLLAALAREGTLTGAAEALGVTQSAASQRLREAERRLGVALAERRGRTVLLNAAGERVATAGEMLERGLAAAESDAIWVGRRTRARLRIAWNHYDAGTMAARLSALCARIGEGVDLEFVRTAGEDAALALKRGDADFAVLPHPATAPGISSVPLFADRLVALAPLGADLGGKGPLEPGDFHGRPFLTYGLRPRAGWEYDRFFDGGRAFPETIVKIESTELIVSLVRAGRGLSILPARSVPDHATATGPRIHALAGIPLGFEWRLHERDDAPGPVRGRLSRLVRLLRADEEGRTDAM